MKIKTINQSHKKEHTYDIEVDITHNYLIKCGDVNLISHNSSVLQASTNGVEPITSLVVRKTSKGKTCIQVVPGIAKWKNSYLKKSDIKNNDGIIRVNAAIGKWLCMASSFNLYYNSNNYEDGNVPMSVLIKDHLYATHLGMKTFYYCNSIKKKDSLAADFKEEESGCSSGSCSL